jgi:hypothetical protein
MVGHIYLPKTHRFANDKSLHMSNCLTIPRSSTWEALQRSRNLAAVTTLSTGLTTSNAELRQLSLQALLARDEELARRKILLNWEHYQTADLELLRAQGSQFVQLSKSLLASGNLTEKRTALSAIADLDLSDSIDVVLEIVVNPTHALCAQATGCLMHMCERWGTQARQGKDLPSVRGKMLDRLYAQLALFHQHQSLKLIEAWLCLVHWDDSAQRGLLSDSRQDAYRPLIQRLRTSDHPAVLQLLAGYASRSTTPKQVLEILVERTDPALAVAIAKLNDKQSMQSLSKRLQSLPPLQCLEKIETEMPSVGVELERRLWLMVASSSTDLRQVLRGALRLSKLGTREARQTAAEMLRTCRKPGLDTLVPALQAAEFASPDDEQCLGNLTHHIAAWLSSPSLALKRAAREFFKEFTVENLLDQVRHWPTEMCRAMARIVKLVEKDVTESLTKELQSPAPRRRLAALQATQLLECADDVSQILLPLLNDPRLEVRVRTIDLLGALGHESLETLIPELLQDASTDIQDAANRAVRRIQRIKKATP